MAHVLFVDSDPFFVRLYVDMLTAAGHRTSSVNKLPEFEQLKDESFDIAFVELGFQFEHGLKIVEQLKNRARPPEIVGVVKQGEQALLGSGLKQGVIDVLTKPIEGNHLVALIARLIERQKLHQEARRLQSESAIQQSLQKAFNDGLSLLKTLDDSALHEKLLKTASVQSDCQGIALYVAKRTHLELVGYYGLIEGDKLPPSLALSVFDLTRSDLVPNVYAVDDPMAIQKGEAPKRVEPAQGKGLVFVLAQDHQAEGIVVANARLGHPFQPADMSRLQVLADVSSVAFMNSRRYVAERKKAVQTRNANTYNMSFFVDFLGKELHKSRRYRRSFSIVQMVFDNYPGLAAELGARGTERLANDIPRVLQDVLRESDVLARASDNEYLIVLPESDIYGARMTMGRIEAALVRDPSLLAMQKNLTLGTAIAYSSFPQDGNDIDSLMAATRRRLDEMRRSAYRKLHFEESTFYEAAQLLLAKGSPMRRFIDSPVEYAYTQMTPIEVAAWVRELLRSTQALQKSHSVLYWGVPEISIDILAAIADVLEVPPAGSPNRLFVLGAKDSSIKDVPPGITTVYLEPEKATQMGFLFSLSETHAYAMIGENLSAAPSEAFHTCDTHLALGLVRKLQSEFNLQRWF